MSEMKKIPQRSEIAQEDKWAIEDLYATDEAWSADLEKLKTMTQELAAYAGHLAENPAKLLAYLEETEAVGVLTEDLANYCMRKSDEDTRDAKYQAMQGQFMSAAVALSAATSFETPEILNISDETLDGFYAAEPKLERYRRYLWNIRRRKEHVLTPAEEKLLAAAGEMANAPENIYSLFADADLTFADAVDGQGNRHPLSQGTFVSYEESSDRELRKSAFQNLYQGFGNFKNTVASVLASQVKQLQFFSEARKYESSMEASLDATNVPTSVYLNLIEAVHQNMDKMHRYVRLRKKLLGVEELHFYDVYAPLLAGVDRKIPYEEAKQTIYDALAPMGESYRKILKEGFENRWIDAVSYTHLTLPTTPYV